MARKTFVLKPAPVSVPANFKKELNKEQLAAVTHQGGPAIVIAGAGSGKTRVLTYRVGWLLKNGVDPRSIMLVTFTKKAAEEMTSRVEQLTKVSRTKLIAGTFHHIANRYLRRHAEVLGFKPNFTILDRGDSEQLFKNILGRFLQKKEESLKIAGADAKGTSKGKGTKSTSELKKRYPRNKDLADIYSRAQNLHLQVKEVLAKFYPQYLELESDISVMLQMYLEEKKNANLMDFDDLLVYFLRLLRTEGVGGKICASIKHLLVDEYQDVNQLQADIVIEISAYTESTMVVGDDCQAIYSFRGGDVSHMLQFGVTMGKPVKKYFLTTNYRSTPQILDLANASISKNKYQYEKKLKPTKADGMLPDLVPCVDNDEEAHFICQSILEARDQGIPLHEQAVLFRSNYHCLVLEKTLLSYNIPYVKRAGMRFYETAHVKDVLSFAIPIHNAFHRVAWERILGMLKGVGSKSAAAIIEVLLNADDPLDFLIKGDLEKALVNKRIKKIVFQELDKLKNFYKKILYNDNETRKKPEKMDTPGTIVENIVNFYKPYLVDKYENHEDRLAELKEFVLIADRYKDLEELLSELAISETFSGESTINGAEGQEEKPLVLSTIHQAKGLEWEKVYVIHLSENMFPHPSAMNSVEDLEEERRLFYVAVTRAKSQLVLSYVQTSKGFDRMTNICKKSEFLEEIEGENVFQVVELIKT